MVALLLNSTISAAYEWELGVASAGGSSPMSDTFGHVHTLNTTLVLCHIPFSRCNPRDVECGYRFLQHTWEAVKRKYSCGSLVEYSKKDLWLFFKLHCAITSVKGGQIYLSATLYCDGMTLEYHSWGFNTQLLVIDSAFFHSKSQPDCLHHGLC